MRGGLRLSMIVAGLWACNGNKDTDGSVGDDDDTTGPVSFTFVPSVVATEYAAEVVPEAIAAHQVSSMLLASVGLVVADQKVQDRLNTDGGGGFRRSGGRMPGVLDCWTRPDYPMFSFPIDYTGCVDYAVSGGVFVNDHPSGPLLFEFQDFTITDRTIGGVFALDTQGAAPEPLYWQVYNTDANNPGPDNATQIGIELDRVPYGTSYSGGASVDFTTTPQEWSMWGVMTIGVEPDVFQVVHGGRAAEDVAPDEPPGADVLKTSLNWLDCRCPSSGVESQDMPMHFSSLTLDIDALEDVPDDIDDPDIDIPVNFDLAGQGVLTHTGCGTYDVEYQTQAVSIPVTRDQLAGAISFQCATLAIDDTQRCAALLGAANQLDGDLLVEVTPEDAQATALAAVESSFDTAWCHIY